MMLFLLAMAATAETTSPVPEIDFTSLFLKMLALLAVVVVLGFVLIRYFGTSGHLRGKDGGKYFELISWHRLDPKKTLYLVRIGKRTFALGGTDSSVNMITELEADELEDEV